jgi:hypothetical protein
VIWKKADAAAQDWCGGIHPKRLYEAVKAKELKAARIGAGRNLLFCEQWCDAWLLASAAVQRNASAGKAEALRNHKDNADGHDQCTQSRA